MAEIKYLSPNQKAWLRFRKNKTAMAGLLVIIISSIIAIFAPIITPDHTPNANDQILEIATQNPGFTCSFIKKEKQNADAACSLLKRIFIGCENNDEMIPISSYRIIEENILYKRYQGSIKAIKEDTLKISSVSLHPSNNKTFSGTEAEKKYITTKKYWLGTDKFGRDNLSRLILGARVSLSVGLFAVIISLIIGIILGALSGYYQKEPPKMNVITCIAGIITIPVLIYFIFNTFRQWPFPSWLGLIIILILFSILALILFYINKLLSQTWKIKKIALPVDDMIMYVVNVFWPIPVLLLIFSMILALGREFWQIFVAVGLVMWVEVARIVRGQFLGLREKEYVEAAKSLGYTDARTIFKHVLPNAIGPIIVITAANFASAIIIEAGLSFLGIGVQPPMPSWGSMLHEYYGYIGSSKSFLAFLPGIAIMILVLAFNLVGNGLRDALDVRGKI